jgi:guanosine-3',5'-bis(diphosphate) 3'-pyrophosphohydrolase
VQSLVRNIKTKDSDVLLFGEDMQKIDYKLATAVTLSPAMMCLAL